MNTRDQIDVETERKQVDLEELTKRVENYFALGRPQEPAGRIILDLLSALRRCVRKS